MASLPEKMYEALPEPTEPGYDLRKVMAELTDASTSFFRDTAETAVVLKLDSTHGAVIFADDALAEKQLRKLLTERGPRPFPLCLPVGFIAWTRGRAEEDDAAAVRVDAHQSQPNTLLVMAERGSVTIWLAMIPMKEYADEREPALYISYVFNTMGLTRFLGPHTDGELVLVQHAPFVMKA